MLTYYVGLKWDPPQGNGRLVFLEARMITKSLGV
jgi:hypothetical protein